MVDLISYSITLFKSVLMASVHCHSIQALRNDAVQCHLGTNGCVCLAHCARSLPVTSLP